MIEVLCAKKNKKILKISCALVESIHIQLPGEIGRCGWAVNRLLFDDGGSDFTRL